MNLKIKETLSFFILIAFISVAAGGDYYYTQIHNTCRNLYWQRKMDQQNSSAPGAVASHVSRQMNSDTLATTIVIYTH